MSRWKTRWKLKPHVALLNRIALARIDLATMRRQRPTASAWDVTFAIRRLAALEREADRTLDLWGDPLPPRTVPYGASLASERGWLATPVQPRYGVSAGMKP